MLANKGAAAEAVLLCEEVLEVAPKGLCGLGVSRGEGMATQVVVLLEEALDGGHDGGHSCFGLWCF